MVVRSFLCAKYCRKHCRYNRIKFGWDRLPNFDCAVESMGQGTVFNECYAMPTG